MNLFYLVAQFICLTWIWNASRQSWLPVRNTTFMLKLYRWLYAPARQQISLLVMSAGILLYSVLNLLLHERFISISFIFVALCLFIVTVMNRKAYRIHTGIMERIRLIQKEYDSNITRQAHRFSRLNSRQRKLWQYIVSDYSPEELLHIFSLTPATLAKEINELFQLLEINDGKDVTRNVNDRC